jgi:hypothetical protein
VCAWFNVTIEDGFDFYPKEINQARALMLATYLVFNGKHPDVRLKPKTIKGKRT